VIVALPLGGLVLGLLVGRWWALAAAPILGVVFGLLEETEVSGWLFGLMSGMFFAAGIGFGVALRARRGATV
jgi:hypothetical protein